MKHTSVLWLSLDGGGGEGEKKFFSDISKKGFRKMFPDKHQ
jgi:hypothetical protein